MSGTQLKQWAARVVGAIVIAIAYVEWKALTESYELENGVMGTYRPIALGLSYYLLWVFTRKIESSSSKDTERPNGIALFAWFVCISIAAGFFAAHFVYLAAIDRPVDSAVAYVFGFIAFLVAAVIVLTGLDKLSGGTDNLNEYR
jgi:hypothetical protein